MYQKETLCPACHNVIPGDRYINHIAICPCGWTLRRSHLHREARQDISNSLALFLTGVLLLGGLFHFIRWDKQAFAIIPLKIKEHTGRASASDFKKIADICQMRIQYDCQERALIQAAQLNPKDPEPWAQAADLQYKMANYNRSQESLSRYFSAGGKSLDAHFTMAKLFGRMGNIDQSRSHFRHVLNAKPDTIQITVTKAHVDMLLAHKRFLDAKNVIEFYRRKGDNTQYILQGEYEIALKNLGDQQATSKRRQPTAI